MILFCTLNLLSHDMKTGNYGKTRKIDKPKKAGKYGNEEGTGRYGTGLKEGREGADGKIFSVPVHIFGIIQ